MTFVKSWRGKLAAALAAVLIAWNGAALTAQEEGPPFLEELKLFSRALGAVLEGYVGDVNARQMFYEAVRGMMKSLDPYSEFIDPKRFELLQIGMKGEYAGIGTWIREADGFIVIDSIKEGTAADRAGLFSGDKIIAVDGIMTKGKNAGEVGSLLRGEEGTEVRLTILRDADERIFEAVLKRERIEIEAVRDSRLVGKAIGYMHILDFQEHTVEQALKSLEALEAQGMKAMILDLRNNSGGLLTEAVSLSSWFLPNGEKIVRVESKIDVQRQEYVSEEREKKYDYPMVILVNQLTASAAEVFSAAMQDHERATVVGVKTFGKASVQSVIPLDESAAMKLTTARYISPNGRMIDGKGIEPDVVIEDGPAGGAMSQNQIKAALKILKDYY